MGRPRRREIGLRSFMKNIGGNITRFWVATAAVFTSAVAAPAGDRIAFGPYVQKVTPTRATICWSTWDGLCKVKDSDGTDFLTFSSCYNGALNPPRAACENLAADLDGDSDVDGTDFLTFSTCYNGSLNPPRCP